MKCQIPMTDQMVQRDADSKKGKHLQQCSVAPCWQTDKPSCKPTWLSNRQKSSARRKENPTQAFCLLLHFLHSPRCHRYARWNKVPCPHVNDLQQGHRAERLCCSLPGHLLSLGAVRNTFAQYQPNGISMVSVRIWNNKQAVDKQDPSPGCMLLLTSFSLLGS